MTTGHTTVDKLTADSTPEGYTMSDYWDTPTTNPSTEPSPKTSPETNGESSSESPSSGGDVHTVSAASSSGGGVAPGAYAGQDTGHGDVHGSGSGAALPGYPPPSPQHRLPVVATTELSTGPSVLMWAVAAHGGAGASTLAARLGFVGDAGHRFPAAGYEGVSGGGRRGGDARVVICAAETVAGITAAHRAVLQHLNGLGGDTDLVAVVTHPVSPGWVGKKTPKQIAHRLALLDDPRLHCPVIRLGFDPDVALREVGELDELDPSEVTGWLAMDAKQKAKLKSKSIRQKNSLASVGWVDGAAHLLRIIADGGGER